MKRIPPWDAVPKCNRHSIEIWLMLDEIYDWWRPLYYNGIQCGYSRCASNFGVEWKLTREKTWCTAIEWLRKQKDPNPRRNKRWLAFARYHGKEV